MDQGTRTKEATEGQIQQTTQKIGGPFKVGSPDFQQKRLELFEQLFKEQQELIQKAEKPKITITLKDGKTLEGVAYETTPLDIALKISKKLAKECVAAKVVYSNRVNIGLSGDIKDADEDEKEQQKTKQSFLIWDLHRPFEGDCTLDLIFFNDPIGKEVFWHSSAHILGAALENVYGAHLCIGPPLENGFFYDSYMGQEKILQTQYNKIEKAAMELVEQKQQFQRVVLTKQQALEMFQSNPFKVQLITNKIPDNALTTAYKCGKLIDLCTGPHLPSTERVKAFKVTKNSAAYWLGKNTNDDLQRVYGVSFPSKKELDEYIKIQEELAKRDHRNVGKQNQLYQFHPLAPGCGFFQPDGAYIYNRLMDFIRNEYKLRGFQEVITPNLYSIQLFKISGHWDKYQENMFMIKNNEEGDFSLKPMNCPGHCLLFDMNQHSYRDLPIRLADFGVLHRNEIHGALSGLTRVRRFQQDDAHIYCRFDQIEQEISASLDFLSYIYKIFGFEFQLFLSTMPEKHLGTVEIWEKAETQLKLSLDKWGKEYKINPGDGAFYGPKIDVLLFDAYKRQHQCGTIQLDFNLPERFNLQYRASEEGEKKNEDKQEKKQQDKKQKEDKKQKKQKKQAKDGEEQKEEKEQEKEEEEEEKQEEKQEEQKIEPGKLRTGFERPVMIHRAILGSLERMIAVLTEQSGGKWPFWLSPRQIQICPISKKYSEYANQLAARLVIEGYRATADLSDMTLPKKVRSAQLAQYNYIGVVGEEEEKSGTIDVRDRDKNERIGKFNIAQLKEFFLTLEPEKSEAFQKMKENAFYNTENNDLKQLDDILKKTPFLNGFEKGEDDDKQFEGINQVDESQYPNLGRWYQHMKFLKK